MVRCFEPCCLPHEESEPVFVHLEEIEALRLVDLLGYSQEQAAETLGISRRTLWRDLHEARRKVADALVNGRIIEIGGCQERNAEYCLRKRRI